MKVLLHSNSVGNQRQNLAAPLLRHVPILITLMLIAYAITMQQNFHHVLMILT